MDTVKALVSSIAVAAVYAVQRSKQIPKTPYGQWLSPLLGTIAAKAGVNVTDLRTKGTHVYWIQARPTENGRYTVTKIDSHENASKEAFVIPQEHNARTTVHEYGGAAYLPLQDGSVVYANFSDQRLYHCGKPITPIGHRYADMHWDAHRQGILCVRERHIDRKEAENDIVYVFLDGTEEVLASGNDFYAHPRSTDDGTFAYITWNHPNMPWDETQLVLCKNGESRVIADGMAVLEPEFSRNGILHWIDDRSGYWLPYKLVDENVEPLWKNAPEETDIGYSLWNFHLSRVFDFLPNGDVVLGYHDKDSSVRIVSIDASDGSTVKDVKLDKTVVSSLENLQCTQDGKVFIIGGSPMNPKGVYYVDIESSEMRLVSCPTPKLKLSSGKELSRYISMPEKISFPTTDGHTAFGLFYSPYNLDYDGGLDNEKPPLLVKVHGGPTGAASSINRMNIQFWTSRGIAVLDVDYRGSCGYGRDYRNILKKQWGIYDVEDVAAGVCYLVDNDLVDSKRLCIDGGSAGGYTTLAALAFKPNLFKAGCSRYGVGDLGLLAEETHKFESRYLDGLIGSYTEEKELYDERSPLNASDNIICPILFQHGDEDKIVPLNQAELMHHAVKSKGIPTALQVFVGEQHGFRKQENIATALETELYFFGKVLGFKPEVQRSARIPIANAK